jgi:hypothetical protein
MFLTKFDAKNPATFAKPETITPNFKNMRHLKAIILIFAAFYALQSCRQDKTPNHLDEMFLKVLASPETVPYYKIDTIDQVNITTVRFDFGSNQLIDAKELDKLKNIKIKHIQYIYSDFKKEEKFKQDEFNIERLYEIYKIMPELFEMNEDIRWTVITQTGATNEEDAKKLFHGLVIYYRESPTVESMKREVDYIKERLTFIKPLAESKSLVTTLDQVVSDSTSYRGEMWFDVADTSYTAGSGDFNYSDVFTDTVVSTVLKRNKHWNDMLISCDLTGSMSPYSAQLFIWHKLNMDKKRVQHFVFFNDGDMTPDEKKITGKTGGIYFSNADNFDALEKVAFKCMYGGGGGDSPENDVEALLKAIDKYPESKDIILIADNWANMRDYSLLTKVNRPIKIILCGTQFGINKQYLDLARQTKGSIHTIEQDITHLMDLKEGQEIKIGKRRFKILKGQFIEVLKI